MPRIVTLLLTVTVTYELGSTASKQNAVDQLHDLVNFAANRGLLTGDHDMEVNSYKTMVQEL